MKTKLILLTLLLALTVTSAAQAAIPHVINFQGKATDKANAPLNGTYKLTFRIYDALTGGNKEWEEVHATVPITNGIFQVPLNVDLPFNEDYWVSLEVNTDGEMSPRTRLASTGYAYMAKEAESVSSVSIPFYIQGLELEYETSLTIKVTPGALDVNGGILSNNSTSASINIDAAANYIDGKLPGSDIWIYVYAYNNDNKIAYKLSADEPDKVGAAYRCIGAVRKGSNGEIAKFFQRSNTVMWDVPVLQEAPFSNDKWSGSLDCSSGMPSISTLGIFNIYCEGSGNTQLHLKPNGSTWTKSYNGGLANMTSPSSIGGQVICATDSSQKIQYYNRTFAGILRISVGGYILNIR